MFKSRIPLQTPLAIKILLSTFLVAFFVGWSLSSDAASEELGLQQLTVTLKQQNNPQLNDLAQQAHQQINQYRASLNLAPLKLDAQISRQAQIHSQNMAQNQVEFSHDGFENRVEALSKDIAYKGAAENVAYNQGYSDPVSKAVSGWFKSKGHQKNIIGNYNLTGIGVAKNQQGEYFFTQIFILGK